MLAMVFLFNLNVGVANFISSFVAVTFVWFIALRVVFTKKYKGNSFFGPCTEGVAICINSVLLVGAFQIELQHS